MSEPEHRVWLWRPPAPREVLALDAIRLPETCTPEEARGLDGEGLLVLELEPLRAWVAAALELDPPRTAALAVARGRGVALVPGPLGWCLERANVAGPGPPLGRPPGPAG